MVLAADQLLLRHGMWMVSRHVGKLSHDVTGDRVVAN